MLRPIRDTKHSYCGPSSVSAITGEPTSVIEALIQYMRKERWGSSPNADRPVAGTNLSEIGDMFKLLDHEVIYAPFKGHGDVLKPLTLARWMKDTAGIRGDDAYLVWSHNHFIAVQGNMVSDIMEKGGTPWDMGAKRVNRRMRVTGCAAVMPV